MIDTKDNDLEIAADSQIVTYLVEANEAKYDPDLDASLLKPERKEAFRIALRYRIWLLPTVYNEVKAIKDMNRLLQHTSFLNVMLGRTNLNNPFLKQRIDKRSKEFFQYHPKENDCRILAEAEMLGIKIFLTFDDDFQKRLESHTRIKLLKPSQFVIPPGTSLKFKPAGDNPKSVQNWWK
ncbi:MAG: hypothetical protein NUV91_00215 [Candidatus Omnitrophica bacterium]|nr:hypothetical protein [Candidatus Omnitrophota bacterium]